MAIVSVTVTVILRTDAAFIERQKKLSFAAHIKGQTERAVSIKIEPGRLEAMERMGSKDRDQMIGRMRKQYAVHYTELNGDRSEDSNDEESSGDDPSSDNPKEDDGTPMKW